MKYFVVAMCFISVLGCQKREAMRSVVWEKGQGAPPEVPQDLKTTVASVSTKSESVERFVQTWGEAEVDHSFLQIVKNKKNKPVFLKMKYSEKKSKDALKKIDKLVTNKSAFFAQAKKNFSDLAQASYISPVKVIVTNNPKLPEIFYQFDVISKDGSTVQRWKMASAKKVLDKSQVSSYYDGQGMAFPNGPQWSQIEEVQLLNLVDDGSLRNQRVNIITQSGVPAVATQQAFFFKPDDPRFDQVQVFYYANKMIQMFKTRLGVELPFKIEFKTHIGYPDKKTVMFYYDHRIHLGQGDEVIYKDVLKDPTIVMHETAHAFVDALSGLPQGALNEAFADFFTTSFLDNPYLGETSYMGGPYTRSVDNHLTYKDKKENVYGDSQIVSGTLWEIRKALGADKAESLALKTLVRLGPDGEFDNAGKILKALAHSDLDETERIKVIKILENRQFPLGEDL